MLFSFPARVPNVRLIQRRTTLAGWLIFSRDTLANHRQPCSNRIHVLLVRAKYTKTTAKHLRYPMRNRRRRLVLERGSGIHKPITLYVGSCYRWRTPYRLGLVRLTELQQAAWRIPPSSRPHAPPLSQVALLMYHDRKSSSPVYSSFSYFLDSAS